MAPIIRQPRGRGPLLPLGLSSPAEVLVVFGVPACGLFQLAVISEFLARVGACRLEQPIVHCGPIDIRVISDLATRFVTPSTTSDVSILALAITELAPARVKPPAKIDNHRSTMRSDSESNS